MSRVIAADRLGLILYPTDFSKGSGLLLTHALAVARAFAAEIEVFHVELDPSEESPLAEALFPARMVFESLRADPSSRWPSSTRSSPRSSGAS